MRFKASSVALRSKVLKPCRTFLHIFRFKLKKPFSIKALHLRPRYAKVEKATKAPEKKKKKKNRITGFLSAFSSKRKPEKKKKKKKKKENRITGFLSAFSSKRTPKGMDRLAPLKSFSERGGDGTGLMHYPSPATPAYLKAMARERAASDHEEVQDACRSFENYLVEMIIEEGKVMDLMDVEELLYCWKNLKCPVFIDLVGRFYGELCRDLFSPNSDASG